MEASLWSTPDGDVAPRGQGEQVATSKAPSPCQGNATPLSPSTLPSTDLEQLLSMAFQGQNPATPEPQAYLAYLLQSLNAAVSPMLSRNGSVQSAQSEYSSHIAVHQATSTRKQRRIAKKHVTMAYMEHMQMQVTTLSAQLQASQLEAETLRMAIMKMLQHNV